MVEEHTDIKHRRLSSLTPDEYQTVEALLSLLGASIEDDGGGGHLTLNVSQPPFAHNALRIPAACTIDELIGWARLLNRREPK
jgi:hypothetical protein